MNFDKHIEAYLHEITNVIARLDKNQINEAMNALAQQYPKGGRIYVFGNGGSAATASHLTCDFNKGISESRDKKYHVTCLNDNTPTMMAIANDFSYEDIFSMQLESRISADDMVIAISGSGNSPNIIKAVETAKKAGATVIGLSGYDGGKLKKMSDYNMHVPVNNMQIVEDVHMIFNHMIMQVFCNVLQAVPLN